jgi:hypothetical protein
VNHEADMSGYQHRQRSSAVRVLFAVAGFGMLWSLWFHGGQLGTGPRLTIAVAALVLFVAAIVFSSLTVRVSDDTLAWQFGPGMVRKSVPLGAVASAEPTTTSALEGWGIHLTRRGWLYNVAGQRAVLVTLRDGTRFLIGSDEPEALASAILAGHEGRRT